ncbi:MAG: T9SS type A sorting domain-containing protein [Bacteroidetes bacterium]|nr:T9SS type A sorting domain-containing protein [Bacteroidota bacterium]
MKQLLIIVCVFLVFYSSAQDSLRFISGTTGAACQAVKYHNGYLYAGTGSTLRVYDATTPVPFEMTFEYRYKSVIMDILVNDDFLYVAANYDGMTKWDLNEPSAPSKVYDILCDDGGLPMLDVSISGDTIFLTRFKKMSAYIDYGESFSKLGDFGFVSGTARLYGADIKNGICAYSVADVLSTQNGVYLYRTSDFSFLSRFVQSYCWPENVIWGKNNDVLHVMGGTNTVNGYFYSLDISNISSPQMIFSDTILGMPFGFATANPLNAENINDTIYVATTAGLKPGGPLDTTYIHVYDATDPANIRFINYLPAGLWHFDLAVHYPYYYVASEWYGIKTVDYSNFFHPIDNGNTLTGGWNTGSDKYGNYLVVANEGYGYKLYDLADIKNPVLKGFNLDLGFCMKAKFSDDGEYIYTINLTYESFRIYQTFALAKTGAIATSVGTGKFQVYHDRVYVEQELGGNFLNIIDVSDPYNPHVDSTVSLSINDMYAASGKLFISNNDSILVFDIADQHFDRIAFAAMDDNQDGRALAVYDNEVFVYVTQKGLVKYSLLADSSTYSLEEDSVFVLPYGEPEFMAADTFGVYLSYHANGLFACDRQTLRQKGYYRGELETKGYANQYSVQELFCKDDLIFLMEYFSQTSVLTNSNGFSFGLSDVLPGSSCKVMVYPNPFNDQVTIRILSPEKLDSWNIAIYDLLGRSVRNCPNISRTSVTIDRRDLNSGIYVYKITHQDRIFATGKFIIE